MLADLPGSDAENIDLPVTDHTLHVDAEHEADEEFEEEHYIHRKRAKAGVSRTRPLPDDVEEAEVAATYEDDVFSVTFS